MLIGFEHGLVALAVADPDRRDLGLEAARLARCLAAALTLVKNEKVLQLIL